MLKIFYCYELIYIIIMLFTIYMDLFLLYLILRFTKRSQKGTERDSVLGREVPSILFIQNQQLLKETYKTTLALESLEFAHIRAKAEANEFMYYKLKENGLLKRIDENIGIEFLDLDRIMARTQTHDSTPASSDRSVSTQGEGESNDRLLDKIR